MSPEEREEINIRIEHLKHETLNYLFVKGKWVLILCLQVAVLVLAVVLEFYTLMPIGFRE